MKNLILASILLFGGLLTFAQNQIKHPQNGKTIIINENGTWTYKSESGTFKDTRDDKTYKTIIIGTQIWMAENLAYKASNNYWAYNNNSCNVSKYGYLYYWEVAKNICPSGWHLSSDEEWTVLTAFLGGESVAGKKLKRTNGWSLDKGNNESNFNAMPSGNRDFNDGSFDNLGKSCIWWSSSPYANKISWSWGRYLSYNSEKLVRDIWPNQGGYSVRCVKDN